MWFDSVWFTIFSHWTTCFTTSVVNFFSLWLVVRCGWSHCGLQYALSHTEEHVWHKRKAKLKRSSSGKYLTLLTQALKSGVTSLVIITVIIIVTECYHYCCWLQLSLSSGMDYPIWGQCPGALDYQKPEEALGVQNHTIQFGSENPSTYFFYLRWNAGVP